VSGARARWLILRLATLGLAAVHAFPATHHLARLVQAPGLGEAWKGIGATFAVGFYLLPPRLHARVLARAWRSARPLLIATGWVLAVVHLIPAADHLPKFIAEPSWGDAWRGFGSAAAALWMCLPIEHQARAIGWLNGLFHARRVAPSASGAALPAGLPKQLTAAADMACQ
jgi:hypothetical protein